MSNANTRRSNYLLVSLIVFTVAILSRPSLIIVFALVGAIWAFALRTPEVRVGSVVLKGQKKTAAALAVSGILIFLFAGSTIFMVIGFCGALTIAHASFHKTPDIVDDDNADSLEMGSASTAKAPASAPAGATGGTVPRGEGVPAS